MERVFLAFVDDAANFSPDAGVQKFRAAFKHACQSFKGEEVALVLKKRPKYQGTQSMRYYRGVVLVDIAKACGYDEDDDEAVDQMHEHYAWKFLRIDDHPTLGYPRRRSTAKDDMSQGEMTEYIDRVIRDAETTIPDCVIRRPEDVDMDKVYATEAA